MGNTTNHTFVVCAYKDSPYLESCIESLVNQSIPTNILLSTSTPSPFIEKIAHKYGLETAVRHGASDISDDWNFAYNLAKTDLVTIAHQDDKYHREYVKSLMALYQKYPDMLLFFTDYRVIKGSKVLLREKSSIIKRLLLFPLRIRSLANMYGVKSCSFAFGNAICCPSVTYNKKKLGKTIFASSLKYALDWDTFLKIATYKGRFLYLWKPLFYYRIHDAATSKECIVNKRRLTEDEAMFRKIWPGWIAKIIMKFYRKAYKAYD